MRLMKTLGMAGALTLSAVLGGTLIGSALAIDETDTSDAPGTASEYCETFMDAFAGELGVGRDEIVAAGKAAATAALDAAVAAGDLTEDRAAEIRERIEAYDGAGCGFGPAFRLGFGHGMGHGFARGFLGGNVLEAAADALGLESAALIEQIGEADSLEALAGEQGVAYDDVKASILAAVQADLDAAVAEGMDADRAASVIERLSAWLDEGGQLDGPGPLGGRHGRHGFGPWHDHDTETETDTDGTSS